MNPLKGKEIVSHRIFHSYNLNITLVFSVLLPCSGRASGIATFGIGLLIESRKGRPLPGTPLRVKMRKECIVRSKCNRVHTFLIADYVTDESIESNILPHSKRL